MEKKTLENIYSIPFEATFEVDNTFSSEKFIKLRLCVMHTGKNRTKFIFSKKSLENALPSLANSPILARVVWDSDGKPQFGGHDKHIEKDYNGESRKIYDEIPIGVIPEDCNWEIKNEKGKSYLYCDGYVWKNYSNYAQDVVLRDGKLYLSMETNVNESKFKDGFINVSSFYFKGITFLGNDRTTGMFDAQAEIKDESEDFEFKGEEIEHESLEHLIKELKDCLFEFKNMQKGENFSVEENKDKAVIDEPTGQEPDFEDKPEGKEPEIKQEPEKPEGDFELTSREIMSMLEKAIPTSDNYRYVFDYDSTYVYFREEAYENRKYTRKDYRAPYKIEGDKANISIDKTEAVITKMLTKEEWDKVESERANKDAEFEALKEFKEKTLKAERDQKVEEILADFESDLGGSVEFEALKSDNAGLTVEEIEDKCNSIYGKVYRKKLKEQADEKPSKETDANFEAEDGIIKVSEDFGKEDEHIDDPYGGLAAYYNK